MSNKKKITKDSKNVVIVRRESETSYNFAIPSHGKMNFTNKDSLNDFMERNKLLYIIRNAKKIV